MLDYKKFCRDCLNLSKLWLGLLPLLLCCLPLLLAGLLGVFDMNQLLGISMPAAVPVAVVATVVPPPPATAVPPPPTAVPPTAVPPTAVPTAVPPTVAPTAVPVPTAVPLILPAIGSVNDGAKLDLAADPKSCIISGSAKPGARLILNDNLPAGVQRLAELLADASGKWSFDACKLAAGAHRLNVLEVDGSGNPVLASLPIGFEILGPKAVATAVPAPAATAVPAAAALTTIGQAAGSTIAAGSPLKGKCVANQFVDLMVDGKLLATVPCNAAGEWSHALPLSLGVGEHSIQAISVDKDKKKLSESAVIKITIVAPLPVTGGSGDA